MSGASGSDLGGPYQRVFLLRIVRFSIMAKAGKEAQAILFDCVVLSLFGFISTQFN